VLLTVTASIGVASSECEGAADADSLVDLADKTMYEAKKTKNRVVVVVK
jgi:PleD family two-component response regulator